MNTRSIAVIAVFAAVSIALNVVRIPTFYWPGLSYTLGEIPIVVAFLLFGFKIGILAEALRIVGLEIFFPAGLTGALTYPIGGISIFLMISGLYLARRLITHKFGSAKFFGEKKSAIYLTAFAVASRGGIMPLFDYGLMYHALLPLALGYIIPEAYILALVPSFVLYNITVALYTVPIAIVVALKVSKYLKIEPVLLKQT
jgi:riboflavin transporter FmnP